MRPDPEPRCAAGPLPDAPARPAGRRLWLLRTGILVRHNTRLLLRDPGPGHLPRLDAPCHWLPCVPMIAADEHRRDLQIAKAIADIRLYRYIAA